MLDRSVSSLSLDYFLPWGSSWERGPQEITPWRFADLVFRVYECIAEGGERWNFNDCKRALLICVCLGMGKIPSQGSIAVAGSGLTWLKDQMGILATVAESSDMAATVPDNGNVYFVPAFSGLFAPHWEHRARG